MPVNKNALIRYKTIDNCLRNPYRRWTVEDLVDACADALYDFEGIRRGVSLRTIQGDLQMMRSDKLGYNAPIEVYDHKYYRYSDRVPVTGRPEKALPGVLGDPEAHQRAEQPSCPDANRLSQFLRE